MSTNTLAVNTGLRFAKPAHEVCEAIVDPAKMSHYFITTGSGRMEPGKTIRWTFDDADAALVVTVRQVEADRLVTFLWSASGVETLVSIRLEPDGMDATKVKVSSDGWPADAQGIARCLEETGGWMHFLCCLKAHVEYGINLRAGGTMHDG